MIPAPLTANVLNPVFWLGRRVGNKSAPVGSGVAIVVGGSEYLVTAGHVKEQCGLNPRVRSDGIWRPIDWQTLAEDKQNDVVVLKTDTVLEPMKNPVGYGLTPGIIYGSLGYALGFPTRFDDGMFQTDHILEVNGKAIPIAALLVANFTATGQSTYSTAYINAGFSGGAVVCPLPNNSWTIAGVITSFPTYPRPVKEHGKQGEAKYYVEEHTGLIRYVPLELVLKLIPGY